MVSDTSFFSRFQLLWANYITRIAFSGHQRRKANETLNQIWQWVYGPGFTSQLFVNETLMMFGFSQYLTRNLWFWTWSCSEVSIVSVFSRGGSGTAATSNKGHFVIIVNRPKPLTIITKRSILDVAAALDPPLI